MVGVLKKTHLLVRKISGETRKLIKDIDPFCFTLTPHLTGRPER